MKIRYGIAVTSLVLVTSNALADTSANVGVATNYIWRGVTQNDDRAAISGGLDFTSASGFYAGTWASNVDFGEAGYELDGYLGFGGETGGFSYNVGYIYYAYPLYDDSDFSEIGVAFGFGGLTVGVNYQVDADFSDENYLYSNLDYSFDLGDDFAGSIYYGNYDLQADGGDFAHFGVSLSKGEFGFALDKNDIDLADDVRVTISWTHEF